MASPWSSRIYRLEETPDWTLEVVNEEGASFVWDETYPSDDDAHQAFMEVVEDEGIQTFLDKGNVIQFPRPAD